MQSRAKVTPQSPSEKETAETGSMRRFRGYKAGVVTAVAVTMSVYALLYITHIFDLTGYFIPGVAHRSLILAFVLTLCFLLVPMRKDEPRDRLPWYDVLFILVGAAGPMYNFFTWGNNTSRYVFGQFHIFEILLALTTILALLEATRRSLGLAMPLVALAFLLHMFFGRYISGPFRTPAVRLADVVHMMTYLDEGIYGVAMDVAATVIIAFIIFSNFMFATGTGDFFIKLALSLFGHVRGGPAKVAVVASGFMGMLTGSTAANIAATGVFTIPLMKRIGYRPEFAGAVEAVASNGGKIMPPVMGVVAFVMAEWLGIPYWNIAVIAFLPAFLYYIAVFIMVDSEAGRLGLHGMPRSECPPLGKTLAEGWMFSLPIVGLLFLLGVLMYSPALSALYALSLLLLLSLLKWAFNPAKRRGTSLQTAVQSTWRIGVTGLRGGATGMIMPGIACASAGIIMGALSVTQIGLVFSDVVVSLAGGNQFIMLALTALAIFILGMGMESLPAYIMVVIVMAPALLKFGVPPLLTHMFVFWFSIVSFITPPVAVGAYVAAGIAQADPMKTGWRATRLGFCTFTLPFMFVYNPALLLQGSPGEIALAAIASLFGVAFLAWGVGGYFLRKETRLQQILLLVAGLLFITLSLIPSFLGLLLGAVVTGWQMRTILQERRGLKVLPEQVAEE